MGWASIIPAVISGIGTFASMKQANASQAQLYDLIYKNRSLGANALTGMYDQLELDKWYKAQQMQNDELNRRLSLEERSYGRDQDRRYRDQKVREQDWMKGRQATLDQVAKQERAFQIQQLIQNQNLSKQERTFAMSQLQQLKNELSGERVDDTRRLTDYHTKLAQERGFDVNQLRGAQDIARKERDLELKLRGSMLDRTQALSQDMELARQELGPAKTARFFDMSDVEHEALKRKAGYDKSLDRATTRMMSEEVAGLMSRGQFGDTIGSDEFRPGSVAEDTLARITAKAAGEYASTYDRAFDEAMQYITGGQEMSQRTLSQDMAKRNQTLDEVAKTYSSLPYEIQAAGLNTGSALYDRDLVSAAHRGEVSSAAGYAPYMNVQSGLYDNINPGRGIGSTLNIPSAAYAGKAPSAVYKTSSINAPGPAIFGQLASSLFSGGLSASGTQATNWMNLAQKSGEGFGTALSKIDWDTLLGG